MCSESSADINHIHRHQARLANIKESAHPQGQQRSPRKSMLKEEVTMLSGGESHKMAPVLPGCRWRPWSSSFPGENVWWESSLNPQGLP